MRILNLILKYFFPLKTKHTSLISEQKYLFFIQIRYYKCLSMFLLFKKKLYNCQIINSLIWTLKQAKMHVTHSLETFCNILD